MKTDLANTWFLRSRPSGDTSLRVSVFTRKFGIIDALYKGGRLPKKKSLLQPFSPLWLSITAHSGWYYIQKLESNAPAIFLPGKTLFAALYLNELLCLLLKPEDPAPELFDAYVKTLQCLTHVPDQLGIEALLRQFERLLLDVVGYGVSYTHDAQTHTSIRSDTNYQFILGMGFCARSEASHPTLISGQHILAFAENNFEAPEVLKMMKSVMRQAIAFALEGKEIQTRKLY